MIFKGVYNIRLVSTESIVTSVYEDLNDQTAVWLSNPMEVTFYPRPNGNTMISLAPWMPFTPKEIKHKLFSDTVITMSQVEPSMVQYYNDVVTRYVNNETLTDRQEPTHDDGIGTVEELEDSLDILEALAEKSKGKLH